MGDVGMGFAYLCSCCCCGQPGTDPGPDGSQFRRAQRDPREQLVDRDFMKRDYKKDKHGNLQQIQPGSASQMVNPTGRRGPDNSTFGKAGG
ncbi:hypothetical protein V5O48_006129 [Marasmius crinis-equi]|uniref:Uncharacterized protein n=1 Tax=Marasmius crinis-equi TaxID=585013 RepID=A0ABR3FKC0_9AGAR